jgi:flagellar operon protein
LNHAVKAAEAKGIKESLVMMDNLAFIINIKNNTVVTAVTGGEEKIFSNIDGAVVV